MDVRNVIADSGLRIAEVARVCKVSRGTIYNRINGAKAKSAFMESLAEEVLKYIVKATEDKKFPPPKELVAGDRFRYINKVLLDTRESLLKNK